MPLEMKSPNYIQYILLGLISIGIYIMELSYIIWSLYHQFELNSAWCVPSHMVASSQASPVLLFFGCVRYTEKLTKNWKPGNEPTYGAILNGYEKF